MKKIKIIFLLSCMLITLLGLSTVAYAEEISDSNEEVTITYLYYIDDSEEQQAYTVTVKKGEEVSLWEPPKRKDYTFDVWLGYWETENIWRFCPLSLNVSFDKDTTLEAQYEYTPNYPVDENYDEILKNIENDKKMQEQSGKAIAVARMIRSYKPKLSSVKNNKKKLATIKASLKVAKAGYQIQYSTSKKFKKAKKVSVASTKKKITTKIKKLKKGKTYYVRVRAYRIYDSSDFYGGEPNEKRYYSKWSNVKKVTIKK